MRTLALFGMLMIAAAAAHAEGFALGAGAGTMGLGVQGVMGIGDRMSLRTGGNALAYSYEYRVRRVDYDAKVRMASVPIVLDWFFSPGGNLRMTGGLYGHFDKQELEARPRSGVYVIGNNTYGANEIGRIDASVKYRSIAPYIGAGWGDAVAKGKTWSWNVDAGILYIGKPKTTYTVSCGAVQTNCARLQGDTAIEAAAFDEDRKDERVGFVAQFWVGRQF
jgi:hypothetical protein